MLLNSENAAAEVPLDTKQLDRDLADNSYRSMSMPPLNSSENVGHKFYNINDWWSEDKYNKSGVEQISELFNFLSILKQCF